MGQGRGADEPVTAPAQPCPHLPARLYSWFALAPGRPAQRGEPEGRVLIVACCDCGAVLKGASDGLEEGDDR